MLLSCTVDCGEVLPGHRLVARGLRDDGTSDDNLHGDYTGHYDGKPVHRVVSLVYELIPGLPRLEDVSAVLDVDASVALDPPSDPELWGSPLMMGSERDDRAGGSETAGAFGPFILPHGTERVIVELRQVTVVTGRAPRPAKSPPDEKRLGTLEVRLSPAAGHWTPT